MNWLSSSPAILLLVTAGLTAGACAGEVSLEGKTCPCERGWVCCNDGVCAREPGSCASTAGAPGEGGSGDSSAEGGNSGDSFAGGDGGTDAAPPECPGSVDFKTSSSEILPLGPHNRVFLEPSILSGPVQNYADQVVFPGPTLSLLANFPEASSNAPADPSAGSALEPWLAELSLVPQGCEPRSLTGKTVRVRLLWRLGGAIAGAPPHGVFLGSYLDGEPVYYPDASQVQLGHERNGTATGTRTLNTLNPIVLTHTFTEDEESAYLRVYLLEEYEIPTTLYVESVTWGEGDMGGSGGAPTGGSGGVGGSETGGQGTAGVTSGGSTGVASGGTNGGGGAAPVGECTRPQAEACPETCDAPSAACLQNEDEQVPEQSVHLSGTVTTVVQEPWTWPYDCLGMRGPFGGAQTERVRVDLLDDEGKTWTLSFLPELIAEDRFQADDELQVDLERMQANVFNVSRKLSVTRDGEPDAFFIDATFPEAFPNVDGLAFNTGELSCAYSIPGFDGCTTARSTIIAASSSGTSTDPCRVSFHDYTVSTRFQYAGRPPASCNASVGSCDAQSSFVASGVRER